MELGQRVELGEHVRSWVGCGAGRRDAVEHPVQLVMLEDDGLVEAFDERAAVVAGGQDAVVLELDDGFLDRHSAQAELVGDLVAVDPIS